MYCATILQNPEASQYQDYYPVTKIVLPDLGILVRVVAKTLLPARRLSDKINRLPKCVHRGFLH